MSDDLDGLEEPADDNLLPLGEELPDEDSEEVHLPDRPPEPLDVREVSLAEIQLLQNVRSEAGNVDGLAENIRVRGLLHPIVLRPAQDASHGRPYELVVGYRRLRAFEILERVTIPARIHAANDQELLAELISENLQREGHSPLDEARVMQRMIDTFDWSHAQVAAQLGVDRSQVTKRLGLLKLPEPVQELVADGQLTASHAEVVARLNKPESQVELAELAVKKGTPVAKLHNYATKIKERDKEDLQEEDPEAQPEDPTKPLDTVSDDQVVDLPALRVREGLSEVELLRADLYILLRAGNDVEMMQTLAEKYDVPVPGLWEWIAGLSDAQVAEMRRTMIYRWLGAAHRFSTLPLALQQDLGDGASSLSQAPPPELPVEPSLAETEWDDEEWDEDWDDDEL